MYEARSPKKRTSGRSRALCAADAFRKALEVLPEAESMIEIHEQWIETEVRP